MDLFKCLAVQVLNCQLTLKGLVTFFFNILFFVVVFFLIENMTQHFI